MTRLARLGFGQSEVLGKFESEVRVWNLDKCITILLSLGFQVDSVRS